jgi:DNA repair exonuclease SbcCD ATPase subunit
MKKIMSLLMILMMIFSVGMVTAEDDDVSTTDAVDDATRPTLTNARPMPAEALEGRAEVIRDRADALDNRAEARQVAAANVRATVKDRVLDRYQNLDADTQARLRNMYQSIDADQRRALARASPELVRSIVGNENTKKLLDLPPAALERIDVARLNDEDYRERLVNRVEEEMRLQENNFKYREITRERMEQARERYEEARENFERIQERVQETREEFNEIREEILACKEDPDAENCGEVTEISKRYIQRTIDYVRGSMEKLSAKVDSSEELSEEAVTERLAEIEGIISELDALEERLVDATNFEEVRTIGQEVNEVGNRARNGLKVAAGSIANNKMRAVLAQSNALQKRLEIMLSNLEEAGIDTSTLDEEIQEFNAKIEEALALSEEIDANYDAIESGQDISELTRLVNDQMKEARDLLKDAGDILKDIFSNVRDLQKEARLSDEELEDDEDSETETNSTA